VGIETTLRGSFWIRRGYLIAHNNLHMFLLPALTVGCGLVYSV
jgi:hypothetical protein